MKLETSKGQTKQEKNAQETNKTATAARGTDGTQFRVPSVEPKGSAKSTAAVTPSTSDRSKFVKVTYKNGTKPTFKTGVGLSKNEFRAKTTQPRPKTPIPKRPFPKSNFNTRPNYQHVWNQNTPGHYQAPNYMSWNPYVLLSYLEQVNGMLNQNGPMRNWGPNV
jgi:hypothetical protein